MEARVQCNKKLFKRSQFKQKKALKSLLMRLVPALSHKR